jgi:hypothetical protein
MLKEKARLIKPNSNGNQSVRSDVIDTVSALNPILGEQLRDDLLSAFNYTPSATSSDENDSLTDTSYTNAVLDVEERIYTDTPTLIEKLKAKIKVWKSAGESKVDQWISEFTQWAIGLAPTTDESGKPLMLEGFNAEGFKVSMPATKAIESSVSFLLFSLCELSNNALLGQVERAGKNGRKKSPKPSIFNNGSKGAESTSIEGGNENWRFRSTVKFLVNDGIAGQKYCKAVELIGRCAKALNQNEVAEADRIFRILTGQLPEDKRFSLNASMIQGLVIARGYGLLVSSARQWIKQLEQSDADSKRKAITDRRESEAMAKYNANLQRMRERIESQSQPTNGIEDVDTMSFDEALAKVKDVAEFNGLADLLSETDFAVIAGNLAKGEIKADWIDTELRAAIPDQTSNVVTA